MMEVTIEKLVHGGQGLGTLPDGRKVFVWGALPGERVEVNVTKGKRSYAEAFAENIIEPSPLRVAPREDNYLATSPWQIIDFAAENDYKKRIVEELFTQAHVPLPDFTMTTAGDDWHYRNKMEYSFWGDEDGLHLALHNRGSHNKSIVQAVNSPFRQLMPPPTQSLPHYSHARRGPVTSRPSLSAPTSRAMPSCRCL